MKDIVIYTTPEILAHKKGSDGHDWYYWSMTKTPKSFDEGCLIYFAVKRFVVGSFVCDRFNPYDEMGETLIWNKNSWNALDKPIPTKPFRGFRYKWW